MILEKSKLHCTRQGQRQYQLWVDPEKQGSYEVSNVHRHLIYLRTIILLNVAEDSNVVAAHKVDCHTLRREERCMSNCAVNATQKASQRLVKVHFQLRQSHKREVEQGSPTRKVGYKKSRLVNLQRNAFLACGASPSGRNALTDRSYGCTAHGCLAGRS